MPPGTPVRLAKRTSNLFRFREHGSAASPGSWTSPPSATCCTSTRPGRTARVGGMTTYEDLATRRCGTG